jgi:hypothetical protein
MQNDSKFSSPALFMEHPILIDQSHEAMGVPRPAPPFPEN